MEQYKNTNKSTNEQQADTLTGSEPDYVKLRPTYRPLPNNQSL